MRSGRVNGLRKTSAIRQLGIANNVEGTWRMVNTTGDPYYTATDDQVNYGENHVLPYVAGHGCNVMWSLVPQLAAVTISFLRCVPVSLAYNGNEPWMDVVMMPGDRCLIVNDGHVYGYHDSVGSMVYFYKDDDCHLNAARHEWQMLGSRCVGFAEGLGATSEPPKVHVLDKLWSKILYHLLKDKEVSYLTPEHRSKLEWELRIRAGA